MAASGSHSPLYSLNPSLNIDPIFLLQSRFLYVRNAMKIIVYVSDEWAYAHFFFPKCLRRGAICKALALDTMQTVPGEGRLPPY